MQLVLSGDPSGRLLKYNPQTKETTVLHRNLQFPNGVSMSKDGSFFVFCEGSRGRSLCRTLHFISTLIASSSYQALNVVYS
jgi:sugar lactone lactonase YvrE